MIEEIDSRVDKSLRTISNYKEYENFIDTNTGLAIIDLGTSLSYLIKDHLNINITVKGNCKVYADGTLSSVFNNLLSNSINHGKADEVHIAISSLENRREIIFTDNGTGIPKEIQTKVFDEGFYYGESGHIGIGLFLVKKTIERYGGTIEVLDNEAKGATFKIILNKAL